MTYVFSAKIDGIIPAAAIGLPPLARHMRLLVLADSHEQAAELITERDLHLVQPYDDDQLSLHQVLPTYPPAAALLSMPPIADRVFVSYSLDTSPDGAHDWTGAQASPAERYIARYSDTEHRFQHLGGLENTATRKPMVNRTTPAPAAMVADKVLAMLVDRRERRLDRELASVIEDLNAIADAIEGARQHEHAEVRTGRRSSHLLSAVASLARVAAEAQAIEALLESRS